MGGEWVVDSDTVRLEPEPTKVVEVPGGATDGLNRVHGRITRCGTPAVGVRVVAVEELTIGIETEFKPCLKTTATRRLGEVTTDAEGSYSVAYPPAPGPLGFCAYSARVRVDVFEEDVLILRSPERLEQPTVHFDLELFPDCSAGESVIVVQWSGRPMPGAQVFVNGFLAGMTDQQGAFVAQSLDAGDVLVARRRLDEHKTDRGWHGIDSLDNWSHRTYITSLAVRHDAAGDNVELRQHVVVDPAEVQILELSTRNTLVAFNLVASIEWDATSEEIRRYTDRLMEMSELLYNATDGQFLAERVSVYDDRRAWDDADIRIYANVNQHSEASVGDLFSGGGQIRMNPNDAHEPSVSLHELGHYAFNVRDEYKPGFLAQFFEGPHVCTHASVEDSGDFSEGGTKDSCLMRGARNAEIKKLCSTHPANPHVITTAQGVEDCWSEILDRYGDARWRLRSPAGRDAIVDVLPDSGIPLNTSTAPPQGVGQVASYIPVEAWKPARHTSSVVRAGACPGRVVRTVLGGSPGDGVRIWLEPNSSNRTYQGVTGQYELAYGETNGPGELRLRGAHVGDRVVALYVNFPSVAYGAGEIDDCDADPMVITMGGIAFAYGLRVEPAGPGELRLAVDAAMKDAPTADLRVRVDGVKRPMSMPLPQAVDPADAAVQGRLVGLPAVGRLDLQITALEVDGSEIVVPVVASFASTREEEDLMVRSADGRLELVLPPAGLPSPLQVVVHTAFSELPEPPHGYTLIGDAYRVASSQGDTLASAAAVSFELDVDPEGRLRTGRRLREPQIVSVSHDREHWVPIDDQELSSRAIAGWTDHLSTFALLVRDDEPKRGE
jgi:hypothetical protein